MRGRKWRRQGREMPVGGKRTTSVTHTQQHRAEAGVSVVTPGCAIINTLGYSSVDPCTAKWMMEFNEEIKQLQVMIRQYSTCSGVEIKEFNRCGRSDKASEERCICGGSGTKRFNRCLDKSDKSGQQRCFTGPSAPYQSELKKSEDEAERFNRCRAKSDKTDEERRFNSSSTLEQSELKESDQTLQGRERNKIKRAISNQSNQSSLCDSGFEESLGCDGFQKDLSLDAYGAQGTTDNLLLPSNGHPPPPGTHERLCGSSDGHEPPPATLGSEECCSMQSVASRDSGVYTTDDTNTEDPTEKRPDRSLLEELDSVYASSDLSMGPCVMRIPGLETVKDHMATRRGRYPDWYIKFSFGDPNNLPLGPLYQSMNHSLGNISSITVTSTVSGVANSVLSFTESTDETDYVGVDQAGQEIKNIHIKKPLLDSEQPNATRKQYEAVSENVSEVRELAHDFSRINERLQSLRSDLESLSSEASESKEDFRCLECRASHLVSSAAASRVRLSQLYAMKMLEERLQEEWWAAYNAHTLPLHENYIV